MNSQLLQEKCRGSLSLERDGKSVNGLYHLAGFRPDLLLHLHSSTRTAKLLTLIIHVVLLELKHRTKAPRKLETFMQLQNTKATSEAARLHL